jgi:hypothetical protein
MQLHNNNARSALSSGFKKSKHIRDIYKIHHRKEKGKKNFAAAKFIAVTRFWLSACAGMTL